jgi:transposase
MNALYYIGLDIHKKTIVYCIKRIDGAVVRQGIVASERKALRKWLAELPGPWYGAMEATIFTGWVYDFLKPHAIELKVAHPAMLKAITSAKKKNDRADAEKIADLLRVNLLPECHMMPEELRELRRVLRFRNMIVATAVKMKNKTSGLLMEVGAVYDKKRLHGKKYFNALLERVEDVPDSVKELLKLSRNGFEMFDGIQKKLVAALQNNRLIRERVERLMSIPGIGELTALTWVLEIGMSPASVHHAKPSATAGYAAASMNPLAKSSVAPSPKNATNTCRPNLLKPPNLRRIGMSNWRCCMRKSLLEATRTALLLW